MSYPSPDQPPSQSSTGAEQTTKVEVHSKPHETISVPQPQQPEQQASGEIAEPECVDFARPTRPAQNQPEKKKPTPMLVWSTPLKAGQGMYFKHSDTSSFLI